MLCPKQKIADWCATVRQLRGGEAELDRSVRAEGKVPANFYAIKAEIE